MNSQLMANLLSVTSHGVTGSFGEPSCCPAMFVPNVKSAHHGVKRAHDQRLYFFWPAGGSLMHMDAEEKPCCQVV